MTLTTENVLKLKQDQLKWAKHRQVVLYNKLGSQIKTKVSPMPFLSIVIGLAILKQYTTHTTSQKFGHTLSCSGFSLILISYIDSHLGDQNNERTKHIWYHAINKKSVGKLKNISYFNFSKMTTLHIKHLEL